MAPQKKKKSKQKKQPQFKGHYCKVCGERKANEKFSGKGHNAHICKSCASKSPAQQSEDMTINKLNGMAFRYLSKAEIEWLKNRRNDSRPEVRELANEIYAEKFPRNARNEINKKLHIKRLLLHVCDEMYDNYGDMYFVNSKYTADSSGRIIKRTFDENNVFLNEDTVEIGVSTMRKQFNVTVNNYNIFFWDTDVCKEISYDPNIDLLPEFRDDDFDFEDFEEDDEEYLSAADEAVQDSREYTWYVEVKYMNGTEQNIKGYDFIPDEVLELYFDLEGYFEDELSDFDEDFEYDDEFDSDDDISDSLNDDNNIDLE